MNPRKIFLLIITIILIKHSPINYPYNIEVTESYSLDKEKRELFRKLKVKTETEVKEITQDNSKGKSIYIYKNFYDKNGNNKRYEFYVDSISSHPYYQIDFLTDENGNILEGYKEGNLVLTQEFDGKGNMTELNNYDSEGEVEWSYEYEYDEMGNLTVENQYLYGDLFNTNEYNAYEYITIGGKRLMKSKISLLENSKIIAESKILYEYDSLGRETFYQEYRRNHKLYCEKFRDYYLLIGYKKFFNSNGMLELVDSIKLNIAGDIAELDRYDNGGNLKEKNVYEYDAKRNRIEQTISSGDSITLLKWKYDELGKELEFRKFENGAVKYIRTSTYSDNGLLLEEREQNEIRLYTYEFY
ncbi:MAG: hypothetical protein ACM34O_12135 [Ignavibacteria bacterium]